MNNSTKNAEIIKSVLDKKGVTAFAPYGNSMWPFIKNHASPVIIERNGKIALYSVVLFERNDGSLILHRVIGTGEDYLVRGDSILTPEKVNKSQILGVMTGFYKGKKLVSANDEKYLKKVKKWYERKGLRKFRIRIFYRTLRLKKLFKGKKNV